MQVDPLSYLSGENPLLLETQLWRAPVLVLNLIRHKRNPNEIFRTLSKRGLERHQDKRKRGSNKP